MFRPLLTPAAGLVNTETISSANAQFRVEEARPGSIVLVAQIRKKHIGSFPGDPAASPTVEVDAGVQLVLTGPLSACTIWAFQSGPTTVLVHANANAGNYWPT